MWYNVSMSVTIKQYSDVLVRCFESERERLVKILPSFVRIEHVGSTAVGVGGKNIIDILIGVPDRMSMNRVRDILVKNGYFEGRDTHPNRLFLASKTEETNEGDFHIHICPIDEDSFKDFIILRDYFIKNPDIAKEYESKKHEFAKMAGFNRKRYKTLKSEYVSNILLDAKRK